MSKRVAVVGAGFSGAVVARSIALAGHPVNVFDSRDHVAGNCHTKRDTNGVMVHEYGPHIFHTANERVWSYINEFGEMVRYDHQVFARTKRGVYSLPINLLTLNQLLGKTFSPSAAAEYLDSVRTDMGRAPTNFREAAESAVGSELFEVFFKGYTEKQWGRSCEELPAGIFARLPIRTNYSQSYFDHPYQAIPRLGYTSIVEKILDHPLIDLSLSTSVAGVDLKGFDHVVWTGPVDEYFEYRYGRLPYRTLDFEREDHQGDFQGCAIMNYPESEVPFTRITEHKHFASWEHHDRSTIFYEYSRECERGDIPFYPVHLSAESEAIVDYRKVVSTIPGVTFLGRLGTFQYIDMDVTIGLALDAGDQLVQEFRDN